MIHMYCISLKLPLCDSLRLPGRMAAWEARPSACGPWQRCAGPAPKGKDLGTAAILGLVWETLLESATAILRSPRIRETPCGTLAKRIEMDRNGPESNIFGRGKAEVEMR